MTFLVRFEANTAGRDYVVGDIHGCFGLLSRALDELGFEPATDRLFAVGDLIDRGPDSDAVGEWLARPWFHALRGNHEELAINAEHDGQAYAIWLANGGEWWQALTDARRAELRALFAGLPLAFEIDCGAERVGIVHAEVPFGVTWDGVVAALAEGGDPQVRESLVWGRRRLYAGDDSGVPGVARLYCGHTIVAAPERLGNVVYLDTGAFRSGRLTVVALFPPTV